MWNTKIQTLEVTELSDIVVNFEYTGTKQIKQLNKSCGCTATEWINDNTLQVTIETGLVRHNVHPKLLEKGKDNYLKYATIQVVYDDDTKDTLKVEATVKAKFDKELVTNE